MANLRQLLLLAFVAAAACSFTGGARAAPKKAAKAVKKAAPKKVVAAKKAAPKKAPAAKKGGFSPSTDIGVTPPLGLFDPLGFLSRGPEVYRRYQEIEIKHGRLAWLRPSASSLRRLASASPATSPSRRTSPS